MRDLCEMFTDLGMQDARSLLQTGNLVFRGDISATAHIERLLEKGAEERLGLETSVFVRTAEDWKTIIAANPFPKEAKRDPSHLVVMFLKNAPKQSAVAALQKAITGREVIQAKGQQGYIVYPDGIGRSRLTNVVIERHLGAAGTGRNWNTVLKLGSLATAA
jgi:uncharacterized protein (DUF1697 family)